MAKLIFSLVFGIVMAWRISRMNSEQLAEYQEGKRIAEITPAMFYLSLISFYFVPLPSLAILFMDVTETVNDDATIFLNLCFFLILMFGVIIIPVISMHHLVKFLDREGMLKNPLYSIVMPICLVAFFIFACIISTRFTFNRSFQERLARQAKQAQEKSLSVKSESGAPANL